MTTSLQRLSFLQRLPTLTLASLFLVALLLSSCKKDDTAAAPAAAIQLRNDATLGSFLTDEAGNTLYYFTIDVTGSNNCGTPECDSEWPIFYAATPTVGPGLNQADFTTGKTASGRNQTFYKGWPLYYFATPTNGHSIREAAGQTLGEGVNSAWYVVRPDYSVMMAMNAILDKTTNEAAFKSYLIDAQGRTLYTYRVDATHPTTQPANCTGGCVEAWPIFYQAVIKVPSGLKASDFGTITRTDGPTGSTRLQTTYKGQPLYYYSLDNAVRGKAEGEGGDWTVAIP
jgi:predicted lipoprotein with Yx(FWY)xxD motif